MATALTDPDVLRHTHLPLNDGHSEIPALGFGTLIPDPVATRQATKAAMEMGFRHFDCAERYRNESEVGEAMREVFQEGKITRSEVFVTTKLWNTNHRPERVPAAFEASRKRLGLDYLDLYLIHTPFAFRPGDEQDPRDSNGRPIYDEGVTLLDTWGAMESLVDGGSCKAIGLSDCGIEQVGEILQSRGSSRPWFRSRPILTFQNGSFSTSAGAAASCCWLLHRWATPSNPGCWMIQSSPALPRRSGKLPRRSCSLGPSSAERR